MAAFLTQQGLNPSIVGGFSGLCAFTGVAATFVSASLVKRRGWSCWTDIPGFSSYHSSCCLLDQIYFSANSTPVLLIYDYTVEIGPYVVLCCGPTNSANWNSRIQSKSYWDNRGFCCKFGRVCNVRDKL